MVASKELKGRVNRLSLAERFRLLHWLANRDPDLVRNGIAALSTKEDMHILAWSIGDPATEVSAGDSDPPAAMG